MQNYHWEKSKIHGNLDQLPSQMSWLKHIQMHESFAKFFTKFIRVKIQKDRGNASLKNTDHLSVYSHWNKSMDKQEHKVVPHNTINQDILFLILILAIHGNIHFLPLHRAASIISIFFPSHWHSHIWNFILLKRTHSMICMWLYFRLYAVFAQQPNDMHSLLHTSLPGHFQKYFRFY